MRVTIHIGAPKTGSTALERFLTGNIGQLAKTGHLYPDVNLRGYGHHDLAFLIHGGYPDWATPQPRTLSELMEDLRHAISSRPREMILSSEDFYIYPEPDGLLACLRDCGLDDADDIRIVIYLRRQDEAHISWYNQAVKAQGYAGSMQNALQDYRDLWDYRLRLYPWAATFGKDRLMFRVLENGDIRGDFLNVLGLPEMDFDFSAPNPNDRLNRDILEYQRRLNGGKISIQQKRRFHKALIELSTATAGTGAFDDTPLLTATERAAVMGLYSRSNREFAREFLGRDELFSTVRPQDDNVPPWPGLTAKKIARIEDWLAAHGRNGN